MRLLVFGDKTFIRKFTGQEIQGVEITGVSDVNELPGQIGNGQIDIILVNGLKGGTNTICESIKGVCLLPIALLVRDKQVNWSEIDYLTIDGFIPEQATGVELKARLDAILRRCKPTQNIIKQLAR